MKRNTSTQDNGFDVYRIAFYIFLFLFPPCFFFPFFPPPCLIPYPVWNRIYLLSVVYKSAENVCRPIAFRACVFVNNAVVTVETANVCTTKRWNTLDYKRSLDRNHSISDRKMFLPDKTCERNPFIGKRTKARYIAYLLPME